MQEPGYMFFRRRCQVKYILHITHILNILNYKPMKTHNLEYSHLSPFGVSSINLSVEKFELQRESLKLF